MKKPQPARSVDQAAHHRGTTAQVAEDRPSVTRPFSAEELRRISEEISDDWSTSPLHTQLTLLDIDPWRVHAYWHVEPADLEAARAALPETAKTALVLRFTDISPGGGGATATPHQRFDIPVDPDTDNRYVNLWQDAKRYSAELGLASGERFVALARSNEVETSRSGPSPEHDFRQTDVQIPLVSVSEPVAASDRMPNELLRNLYPEREPFVDEFPLVMAEQVDTHIEEPPFPELPPTADIAPTSTPWEERVGELEAHFPIIPETEIAAYREQARQHATLTLAGLATQLPAPPPDSIAPTGQTLRPQPLPIGPGTNDGVGMPFTLDDQAAPGLAGVVATPSAESVPGSGAAHRPPPGHAAASGQAGALAPALAALAAEAVSREEGAQRHPAGSQTASDTPETPTWQPQASEEPQPVSLEALLGHPGTSFTHAGVEARAHAEIVIHAQGAPHTLFTLFGTPLRSTDDGSIYLNLPVEGGSELLALLHRLGKSRGD